jgi:hypothetical protein
MTFRILMYEISGQHDGHKPPKKTTNKCNVQIFEKKKTIFAAITSLESSWISTQF